MSQYNDYNVYLYGSMQKDYNTIITQSIQTLKYLNKLKLGFRISFDVKIEDHLTNLESLSQNQIKTKKKRYKVYHKAECLETALQYCDIYMDYHLATICCFRKMYYYSVDKFIENVKENKNHQDNILKEARLLVFFITKRYLNSKEFQKNFEESKQFKSKKRIFLLLENDIDLNDSKYDEVDVKINVIEKANYETLAAQFNQIIKDFNISIVSIIY